MGKRTREQSRTVPLWPVLGLAVTLLIAACAQDDDSARAETAVSPKDTADATGSGRNSAQDPDLPPALTPPGAAVAQQNVQPGADASPTARNARDLVEDLRALAWGEDTANDERAAALLRRLRLQGADAFVPIRDALLDDDPGAIPPALRQALLKVLLGLGLPQVEDLALELLAGRVTPGEIWQLGEYLEIVQPGRHSEAILRSAEQALIDAGPATFFPAEFFRLLGALGNEETAVLLAALPSDRGAYASLALAAMPDGSGLPALEQEARVFEAGQDTLQGRLAIQLLAQQAPQFPNAAAALIELAERGAIPRDLWPYVLDLVAGNWVLTMEPPSSGLVGSHTFYRPEGDQVIYRVAPPPGTDDGFQSERLYLLDRLQPLAPADLTTNLDG